MNWVLVLVLNWSGTASEQIGPYSSQADCEKVAAIVEQQQKPAMVIKKYFCVPKPHLKNYSTDRVVEIPEEFD